MAFELSLDARAELRRAFRYLDDEAPVAPDLPLAPRLRRSRKRPLSTPLVLASGFVLTVLAVAPVALILRSQEAASPTQTATQPVNVPVTTQPVEIPALTLGSLDTLTPPIDGVEMFLLASDGDAVFATASVPNPEYWDERVWRSTDDGTSWDEVLVIEGEGLIVDLAASGSQVVALVSGHVVEGPSAVYRSTDNGASWDRTDLPAPASAAGSSVSAVTIADTTVVVGTSWGGLDTTEYDDGETTNTTQVGVALHAWIVDGQTVSGPAIIGAGQAGRVADIAWNGEAFIAVGATGEYDSSTGAPPAVWTSSDGSVWTRADLPAVPNGLRTPDGLKSVTFTGDGLAVAVTNADEWATIDTPDYSPGTLIYVSTDGAAWTATYLDGLVFQNPISVGSGLVAGAADLGGTGGGVLVTSVDGRTWSVDRSVDPYLHMGVSSPNRIYLTGTDPLTGSAGIWSIEIP